MKWLIILLLPLFILMFGCSNNYGPDYRYRVSYSILKYEDKSEGVVCYMYYNSSISCVKK